MTRNRTTVIAAVLILIAAAAPAASASTSGRPPTLPLGASNLTETRSTTTLARGVTWTHIVRGTTPADPADYNTTDQGPWVVNQLLIDPHTAHGRLEATYGKDIATGDRVSDLVASSGGLIGTNASFFTYTANKDYPGDPVGLGVYGGKLLSEPTTDTAEEDVVFDARSGAMTFGRTQWSGKVVNRSTGTAFALDGINHPPAVPAGCTTDVPCDEQGESDWITTEFGASTPSGPGEEVVLGRNGCVIRATASRGTSLAAGQTAIQATGSDATALAVLANRRACFRLKQSLNDEQGRAVRLTRSTYGVNGRYRLVAGGEIVAPSGTGSMFDRNPRTIIGRTPDGRISLITIDGRMATSVGTTIAETAAVAKSLGLSDATNLDGGGSTTLASPTGALNTPSGSGGTQRLVGDALVWVP